MDTNTDSVIKVIRRFFSRKAAKNRDSWRLFSSKLGGKMEERLKYLKLVVQAVALTLLVVQMGFAVHHYLSKPSMSSPSM